MWAPLPGGASEEAAKALGRIELEPGIRAKLVAAEPPLANPSALAVDARGRLLVVEQDGGMARLRLIEDLEQDGKVKTSRVLAEWPASGEPGLLVHGDRIWIADGIHLWMQEGLDMDKLSERTEIVRLNPGGREESKGRADPAARMAAPQINLGGNEEPARHGLHAPALGPDGRLYVPMGDVGALVKTREGGTLNLSKEGGVLRCEPNGSNLEVFCHGLRDPRHLAFDQYGNLFAADDAPGGHPGRWEYLVEGGDYGWRRDGRDARPRASEPVWSNSRLAEKLGEPKYEGEPAWLLPPVANIPQKTAGLAFYPGTGFIPRYNGHFFAGSLAESPLRCTISSWSVVPMGASFRIQDEHVFASHCDVTDLAFGPNGELYVAARSAGTDSRGHLVTPSPRSTPAQGLSLPKACQLVAGAARGQILEFSDPNTVLYSRATEMRELPGRRMTQLAPVQWVALLAARDQRLRLAAEWALAEAPEGGRLLGDAAARPGRGEEPRLARLHAIWGLGIRARRLETMTPGAAARELALLIDLLEDADEEVCARSAKVLGEFTMPAAYDGLLRAVRSASPRVSFFAAQALARAGRPECIPQVLLMVRENGGRDVFLRHAYVMALSGTSDPAALLEDARDGDASVRLAILLALRRMERPEIAAFLSDEDPALVLEAARAIFDTPIEAAFPAFAERIEKLMEDIPPGIRILAGMLGEFSVPFKP